MSNKPIQATRGRNQLRIIGGAFRRRIVHFPQSEGLRPTPDRVRETLFNWLGQELPGWRCLDLFSGSGALGFEAASRGANCVVMIEQSRQAAKALNDNRQLLGASASSVVCADAISWLQHCRERFDLVLLDPPFASDYLQQVLGMLPSVLAEDARVYIETANWPALDGWDVLKEGRAGLVRFGLLRLQVDKASS